MIKKIIFSFCAILITGCTTTKNQLKSTENTLLSVNNKNTGKICTLYPNKQKIKTFGTLINGKLQGQYLEYSENGIPLLITNYKNGKQYGSAKKYYSNGNIHIKGSMKEDLAHGKFVFFYKDGERQSIKNFKDGIYDGYYMEFYPNGAIKIKGNYEAGYKNDK